MDRRQFFAALTAMGAASLAGCGDDTNPQAGTTSVSTDTSTPSQSGQPWTGPVAITADDDAQAIIEGAKSGSWFAVEPGSTHHITPPFDVPEGVILDGGPPATDRQKSAVQTRFIKDGDGDMATIGPRTIIRGVEFDGRRNRHTGNGLVDRAWNQADIALLGVRIDSMAGDGRVRNATNRWYHRNTRIKNSGGWAMRDISTDHDGPRRGRMVNGQLRRNDKGGIYVAPGARERDNIYHMRAQHNGGPVFAHDPGDEGATSYNLRFWGSWADNAGPAIYSASRRLMGVSIGTYFRANATDIQQATRDTNFSITGPVGDHVHFEGGDRDSTITVQHGLWRPGDSDSTAVAHHGGRSDAKLRLTVSGGESRGGSSIEGAVVVSILDADAFDIEWSDARGGIALSPSEGVVHRAP